MFDDHLVDLRISAPDMLEKRLLLLGHFSPEVAFNSI